MVVFTFSKKRCEENAGTLTNADLCTSSEKSEIHIAIEKALSRLKGAILVGSRSAKVSHTLSCRPQGRTDSCRRFAECETCSRAALASITVASCPL